MSRQKFKFTEKYEDIQRTLPEGYEVEKNGEYFRIKNAHGHPLASDTGLIPYHRYILYEHLGCPSVSACFWCGYILPWKAYLRPAYIHCVNADHVDGNKSNNSTSNLVPACHWCNMNRSWAQEHKDFWNTTITWLRYVPPIYRPFLPKIASDYGITIDWDRYKKEAKE